MRHLIGTLALTISTDRMPCRPSGLLAVLLVALAVHAAPAAQTTHGAALDAATALFTQERFGEAYRAFTQADAGSASAEVQAAAAWAAVLSSQPDAARRHAAEARRLAAPLADEMRQQIIGVAAAAETWMALADRNVPRAFELWGEARAAEWSRYGPAEGSSLRRTVVAAVFPALKERLWNGLFAYTAETPREDMLLFLVDRPDYSGYNDYPARAGAHFTRLLERPDAAFGARMALARLELLDFPQQQRHLEAALLIRPGDFRARVQLGNVQGKQGRVEEALATFRALERGHPDSSAVRWGLYLSLNAAGDEAAARWYLPVRDDDEPVRDGDEVLAPVPRPLPPGCMSLLNVSWHGPVWAARPVRDRTADDVRACAHEARWYYPVEGEAWRWIGDAWFNVGDYHESAAAYDRAARYAPDSLHYQVSRAVSRYYAGEQAAAKVEVERLSRSPSVAAFSRYWLGRMLLAEEDVAGAVPHIRFAAEREAHRWEAHLYLGAALGDAEDFSGAVASLERAVELSPRDPTVLGSLAVAYQNVGRTTDRDRIVAAIWEISADVGLLTEGFLRQSAAPPPAIRVSPAVLGDGWTYAASSATTDFWAQTGRIRPSAPYVQVWTAATPVAGEERAFRAVYTEVEARQRSAIDRVLARDEIDCDGFRARTHETVYYDARGQSLHSVRLPVAPPWSHPVPGSVLEAVVEHVCAAAR